MNGNSKLLRSALGGKSESVAGALHEQYSLLLLYKDDLPESTGQGFPLVSDSPSVTRHIAVRRTVGSGLAPQASPGRSGAVESSQQLTLFDAKLEPNPVASAEVPRECCVWGWWRKPWESHPELFAWLQELCRKGQPPRVLLYNQYLTQMHSATLRAVYYDPFLTTVVIPNNWMPYCLEHYRNEPRLCGAFLALEIDSRRLGNAKDLLSAKFVDSSSFELQPYGKETVIPVPEGVSEICRAMVDRVPSRACLRSCEHTVLLLRGFKQRQYTQQLLDEFSPATERLLASAFAETEWSDIRGLLKDLPTRGWIRLAGSPMALAEIGRKARENCSRVTRFDIELVAKACAHDGIGELLVKRVSGSEDLTLLGKAVVEWATAPSAKEAREAAATVLRQAWTVAGGRYGLADLPDYFERLPAMEAVASAVRYEIGRKFYRDHLNHNVRVALLALQLAPPSSNTGICPSLAVFYAGLFHDIAFPVSAFPRTVATLAKALTSIKMCDEGFRPQRLLDANVLRRSLGYVAILASVRNVLEAFRDRPCSPWDEPDYSLEPADKRLLQELLLCANSEDHAILSAAILFDRAVQYCAGNYDTGVRTLLTNMTGPASTAEGRELLAVLQCIALHDRKAASEYHGVASMPHDTPAALLWSEFELPAVVSLADELQEWGRPVAALDEIAAVDGKVSFTGGRVQAQFSLTADTGTFAGVPYSVLEAVFGKLRTTGRLRIKGEPEAAPHPLALSLRLADLQSFEFGYISCESFRIEYMERCAVLDIARWPKEGGEQRVIEGAQDEQLMMIVSGHGMTEGRDFLILGGDSATVKTAVRLAQARQRLDCIEIDGFNVRLQFRNGVVLQGELTTYWFGELRSDQCVPSGRFALEGPVALARINLRSADSLPSARADVRFVAPHLNPKPHILDYDWRFTDRTAIWIVEAARERACGARICYLGCPTLAIWHRKKWPQDTNWDLLDRGHYALEQWLDNLIPCQQYRQYNVFAVLPAELTSEYAVVVADPPWYLEEYRAFCRRAAQLAGVDGLVFVSNYPPFPPYSQEKHDRFNTIISKELDLPWWLGSFEIDYEVPEFERSWKGHEQFQHSALGVYRPAYMDCFRIHPGFARPQNGIRNGGERILPRILTLDDGHYLRCSNDLVFPCRVSIRRRTHLKRMRTVEQDLVGWSTANALVYRAGDGQEAQDDQGLCDLVREWEKSHEP